MSIEDDAGHELGLWPPTAVATYHRLTAERDSWHQKAALREEEAQSQWERAEVAEQQVAEWKAECERQMRLYAEVSTQMAAMVEALRPFSHPDLCKEAGGNVTGDASPIYGRDDALLRLGDFRRAAKSLSTLPDRAKKIQAVVEAAKKYAACSDGLTHGMLLHAVLDLKETP